MSMQKRPSCVIAISLLSILGLLRMASGNSAQASAWTPKASMPTARYFFSLGEVDGKLYAIGGSTSGSGSTGVVEAYDPATNTWSNKSAMPAKACCQATAVLSGRIYVFGGTSYIDSSNNLSTVYEYNPVADAWTRKADIPTARSGAAAAAVDGKIYVIGGAIKQPATYFRTVEMYDPATDTWQKKADMPTARWTHAASVADGKIYVFGGSLSGELDGQTTVEAYDPATDQWTQKTDLPMPVFGAASAVVAGKIYALGGASRSEGLSQSVAEYDPISNSWRERSSLLTGRWALSAGAVAGKIYALGGTGLMPNHSGTPRFSAVEEYDPEAEPTGVDHVGFIPGAAGAVNFSTVGNDATTRTGYAKVDLGLGPVPYALAIFSFKQNGVTVCEAGVPASPPTRSARIFVDYRAAVPAVTGRPDSGRIDVNTGIAVVNSGTDGANVTYSLRGINGVTLSTGHGVIAGGGHFAKFINQLQEVAPDFILPSGFELTTQFGSLEITSDRPLSILALRMTTNQRNEALLTTTPVADLTQPLPQGPVYFPQLADGGGYTTTLLLLNTSSETETGTIQILDDKGVPLVVSPVGGIADSSFKYSIPPGGALHLQTDGFPAATKTGWAKLMPDSGAPTPVGSGVFSYSTQNILVTESGVPGTVTTTHARVYVDLSGGHNTGLAIAAPGNQGAAITLAAFQRDGVTAIGSSQGAVGLPANGHIARFATEFISGLPDGFSGVIDIRSVTPFAPLTMRSLNNQRNDFLLTTFPVADMNQAAPSPIMFPQIADGGGYATQFILLSTGTSTGMKLNFYDEHGMPLGVGK